jgi:hypothetical protein
MQPNEVRIGNWVYIQSDKMVKELDGERTKPYRIENLIAQKARLFDPITLTENILLNRCGFYKYPALFYKCKVCISIIHGKLYFKFKQGNVEIKYLHQLQNLYFALTGEELEINLN